MVPGLLWPRRTARASGDWPPTICIARWRDAAQKGDGSPKGLSPHYGSNLQEAGLLFLP